MALELTMASQAPMAFAVSVLISLLQLKYQNKPFSPFQSHPTSLAVFLFSFLSYALVLALNRRLQSFLCSRTVARLELAAASASVVSLSTVFLPEKWNALAILATTAAAAASLLLLLLYSRMTLKKTVVDSYTVVGFTLLVLIRLLQLKYQNQAISPFQTHPTSLAVFLASFLSYALVLALNRRLQSLLSGCGVTRLELGAALASVVSLLTVFLPQKWNVLSVVVMGGAAVIVTFGTIISFLLLLLLLLPCYKSVRMVWHQMVVDLVGGAFLLPLSKQGRGRGHLLPT